MARMSSYGRCCVSVILVDMSVQDAGASAVPKEEPKATVPPWLAARQAAAEQAAMQDLFGASSSDDEGAPAGLSPAPIKIPGESGTEGKGDASAQGRPIVSASNVSVLKAEEPAQSEQGFTQAAGSNALRGKPPASASEHRSNKDAKPRSLSRPANADRLGLTVSRPAADAHDIAEKRINYAKVAERLRQKASGTDAQDRRKTNAKKRKQQFDPWEPVLESEGPAITGSRGRDAVAEGANTPRRVEPWGAAASDEDARVESHDDSSAASDSTKHRSRAAALGRRGSTKRKALQPAGSAKLEVKIPTIPEALKQALAAQVLSITASISPTSQKRMCHLCSAMAPRMFAACSLHLNFYHLLPSHICGRKQAQPGCLQLARAGAYSQCAMRIL